MTEEELLQEQMRRRPQPVQAPAYEYSSPVGTYYGEQGNDQSEMFRRVISDYVNRTDPQRQAEEDARIQRGRDFWTGAGLFANVVGNAINVNGTANGAPSMTWDNDMEKRMYGQWQEADRQLKADRKEAQRRLETLRMQDAEMSAAGAAKRAAEGKAAYDMDYKARAAAVEAANRQANADFDYWRGVEQKKAETEAANEEWTRRNEIQHNQNLQLQRMRTANARGSGSGSGGGKKAAADDKNTVYAGPLAIPTSDKGQAERTRREIARKIVDRMNRGASVIDRMPYPKNDKEAESIIYQHMDDLYDNDEEFRNEMDSLYGEGTPQMVAEEPVEEPQGRIGALAGSRAGGLFGGGTAQVPTRQPLQQADTIQQQRTDTLRQPTADTVRRPSIDTVPTRNTDTVRQQIPQAPQTNNEDYLHGRKYPTRGRDFYDHEGNMFTVDENGDVFIRSYGGPNDDFNERWEFFAPNGDIQAERMKNKYLSPTTEYFIGARQYNHDVADYSRNNQYRAPGAPDSGIGGAMYKVEGNNNPKDALHTTFPVRRFEGKERAPHKLTEKEKKAILENGERPKIEY